ncbi:MAG: hypothetical protein VYA34_09180 [Myxococcota bacterium]|nr:hypothetical protein [Myxococcota bacterium]
MRTTLPLIITFIVGVFMLGEFFIPHWYYQHIKTLVLEFGTVIAGVAFLLGVINLTQVNLPRVLERQPDWIYKAIMLGSMVVTTFFGFWEAGPRMEDGMVYKWLFDFLLVPLNATMFSLLAFYIASAAFRAFRARNAEATVLLVAACIVMLARVPIGEQIPVIGSYLSVFQNWLMDVPNVAARRAIFVGAALGAIATGVRIILGIERSHLGSD